MERLQVAIKRRDCSRTKPDLSPLKLEAELWFRALPIDQPADVDVLVRLPEAKRLAIFHVEQAGYAFFARERAEGVLPQRERGEISDMLRRTKRLSTQAPFKLREQSVAFAIEAWHRRNWTFTAPQNVAFSRRRGMQWQLANLRRSRAGQPLKAQRIRRDLHT